MTAEPEALHAVRMALHKIGTGRFGIYIDPAGARQILGHVSDLSTGIADLTARLRVAEHERDTARAAVCGLTNPPPPED